MMQVFVELQATADRINTGMDNAATSRALVVFNLTPQPLGGIAVFRASMSWPRAVPLSPVLITQGDTIVAAAIQDRTEGPDAKGRPDRCLLGFSLCFAVSDIPPNGWRTYIASYAEAASPLLKDFVETPGLVVVETKRHDGDLPPVGNF